MTTNSTAATVMRGSCSCGANTFEVKAGVGMQRFYCHCLYCQQFMGKPYTDVTFVRAKNVVINGEHATFDDPKLSPRLRPRARLAVRQPRQGPLRASAPASTAAGATTAANPSSRPSAVPWGWSFIPSANFEHPDALPPVQRHIYYRLREQDVADDLPKHHYFAGSQLAIARMIGRVLRRG